MFVGLASLVVVALCAGDQCGRASSGKPVATPGCGFSDDSNRCTPRSSASSVQSSSTSAAAARRFSKSALSAGDASNVNAFGFLAPLFASPPACMLASTLPHLPQCNCPLLAAPSAGTSCWQLEHHIT